MKSKRLAWTLLIFSLPAGVMAQGSGSVSRPTGSGGTGGYGSSPFAVTRSVKGTIAKIQAEKGVVVVQGKKGKWYVLKVGEKTEFKVGKKTAMAGKKQLSLTDFEPGQPVKITYLAADMTITQFQLRRARK